MDKAFKGRAVHKLPDPTQVANVDKGRLSVRCMEVDEPGKIRSG